MSLRGLAFVVLVLVSTVGSPTLSVFAADSDQAGRFYEDGLVRMKAGDIDGAIIQLKNAVKADPGMLAAQALLGRAFLANSQPVAAQESLERALRMGIAPTEVAIPLGQALLMQGKVAELIDRFPPEMLDGSRRAELLVLRGEALLRNGDPGAASSAFMDALAIDPGSVPALLSMARFSADRGRKDEAKRFVEQAIGIAPADAGARYVKGIVLQSGGDPGGALAAYAEAVSINPRFVDARVARVSLLLDAGRDADAKGELEYLEREFPGEPRANYLRAVFLARKGDTEGTRAALAAAGKVLAPASPDILKHQAPDLLLLAGLVFHGLGEHQRAQSYLEAFLGTSPNHVGARKLLGAILLARRDYVSAIKILEPTRRLAPRDPQVMALLGDAYIGRGRPQAAVELLQQAVDLGINNPSVQGSLGVGYLQGKQVDLGIQNLRAAFDRDPTQQGVAIALVVSCLRAGDKAQARLVARKAVASVPDSPTLLNLLGAASGASGDLPGAREAYEKALRLAPDYRPAALNIARIDTVEGRFDAAQARLDALLRSDAKSVQVMHELSRLESRRGRQKESRAWLEKAYAAEPGYLSGALDLIDSCIRAGDLKRAVEVGRALEVRAPEDHSVLLGLAKALAAAGSTVQLKPLLTKMTRLADFDAPKQTQIAELQILAQNPTGAAYSLDKALEGNPDFLPAQILQAEVLQLGGDSGRAEEVAARIRKRFPQLGVGYRLQGDIQLRQGKSRLAVESYRTALGKEPTTDHALRLFAAQMRAESGGQAFAFLEGWTAKHPEDSLALRALAEAYLAAGNYAAARKKLETLMRRDGETAPLLNSLATVMFHQGATSQALSAAERAMALSPEEAAIRDTLGWILFRSGQVDAGLRHLRDARLRDPRNPEIRYHLAAALHQAGRVSEAKDELRAIIGQEFRFPEAAEARALARTLSLQP